MKAFKGTVIALALLLVVVALARILTPADEGEMEVQPRLFAFEKTDLRRVEISRPDGTLVLAEQDDGSWMVEGQGWQAARSMVNRVKHQIHDLTARALVAEAPDQPALYGLGEGAIEVSLTLRNGEKLAFLVGDPNPTAVSYYMQPIPGDTVFTVKKSAMDYYSLAPSDFRERRFASHDANDVDRLEAWLPRGKRLVLQRLGALEWQMEEPVQLAASREEIRRLLGRISAMKATEYVEDRPDDLRRYGLDRPRARILIKFGSRAPMDLLIGDRAGEMEHGSGTRPLAYAMLADGETVYTVPDDFLDAYQQPPNTFRLLTFMRMRVGEVTDMVVDLGPGRPSGLSGRVVLQHRAGQWLWEDGVPVPGSTPSRVALRAGEVSAEEVVAEAVGDPSRWGFDEPALVLEMADKEGNRRSLVLGAEAAPLERPDGRTVKTFFARASDMPTVYRVGEFVIEVAEDAVREYQRKAGQDAETTERHERIHEALGDMPGLRVPSKGDVGALTPEPATEATTENME